MKTKYPFPGLTKPQQRVLDQIALGNDSGHHQATILQLKLKGLIKKIGDKVIGKDSFGLITVPQYEMPIDKHIIWCKYQSKIHEDENEIRKNI